MFISDEFILSNQLALLADIHIANFSAAIKTLEESDSKDGIAKKLGNCTFIKSNAKELPKNIREYISSYKETLSTFENKLPVTYLESELGISIEILSEALNKNGINVSIEEIGGKRFAVFPKEFAKMHLKSTWYVLSKEEFNENLEEGNIDGGIELTPKKFLSWY